MENANAMEEGRHGGGGAAAAASRSPKGKKKLKKIWHNTPMEILHGSLAILSVGTSFTGIILTWSDPGIRGITMFAGILTSVIAPYVYYQQTKLTDINAMKDIYNAMKREVGRLSEENRRLHNRTKDMEQTIDNLADMETALDVITGTQGHSVEAYAEQVEENEEILDQMEKNLKANVLQNLLQVLIRHDRDNDMRIEESEIDNLIRRIKMINGVDVVEEEFRELAMKAGGSLASIMDIIQKSMEGDDEGEGDELRSSVFVLKDSSIRSEKKND